MHKGNLNDALCVVAPRGKPTRVAAINFLSKNTLTTSLSPDYCNFSARSYNVVHIFKAVSLTLFCFSEDLWQVLRLDCVWLG